VRPIPGRNWLHGNTWPNSLLPANEPIFLAGPDRFYATFRHYTLKFEELLVVLWQLEFGRRGAVGIAARSPGRHFDLKDLRIIESLARFANVGMQRSKLEGSRRSHEAYASAARVANEFAHEINNPLQALIHSLHPSRSGRRTLTPGAPTGHAISATGRRSTECEKTRRTTFSFPDIRQDWIGARPCHLSSQWTTKSMHDPMRAFACHALKPFTLPLNITLD